MAEIKRFLLSPSPAMVAARTPPGKIKAGVDAEHHGSTCRRWREKTQKAHGGKDGGSLRGTGLRKGPEPSRRRRDPSLW